MALRDWIGRRAADSPTDGHTVFETRSTKVWINGEAMSLESLEDRGLLEEVAYQLGVPPERLAAELQGTSRALTGAEAEAEAALASAAPLEGVACPECTRTVPDRTGSCIYCGASLRGERLAD